VRICGGKGRSKFQPLRIPKSVTNEKKAAANVLNIAQILHPAVPDFFMHFSTHCRRILFTFCLAVRQYWLQVLPTQEKICTRNASVDGRCRCCGPCPRRGNQQLATFSEPRSCQKILSCRSNFNSESRELCRSSELGR
jgi:hypothetical protein